MNKRFIKALVSLGAAVATPALALCPLCLFAAGAGVGLSQYLGVDDLISGFWLGAFLAIAAKLIVDSVWFKGLVVNALLRWLLGLSALYLPTFASFSYAKLFDHPLNQLWGLDRLKLGLILGSGAIVVAAIISFFMYLTNRGRAWFPFQRVVVTVGTLLLAQSFLMRFVS